jgi:hypothetical protein
MLPRFASWDGGWRRDGGEVKVEEMRTFLSRLCLPFWIFCSLHFYFAKTQKQKHKAANSATNNFLCESEIMAKKTFTIALLLVTVTVLLRLEPVQSSNNFDDDVPREKAKKPKLKPPTQLPEVTNRVYLDIGEHVSFLISPSPCY